MTTNKTFTMIKPDAVAAGKIGEILKIIQDAGFEVKAMKMMQLSTAQAELFYAVHKGKSFFDNLVDFMTSGPLVAIILEKENAIKDYRTLIGATNFEEAVEGTIRKLYASSITKNAVHGADSDENAQLEGSIFFSAFEQF